MLEFVKNFIREINKHTRVWSIRKQMMVCYIIAMLLILFITFTVVMLTTYSLRFQTAGEMDNTLSSQSRKNMQTLVRETSLYMHSKITQVTSMFGLVQRVIINMYNETTFSLSNMLSYTPTNLPEKCWLKYLGQRVCQRFSSYIPYGEIDEDFLDSISRLDNIFPSIFTYSNDVALRYYMYFPEKGIFKTYPGMKFPNDSYNPVDTEWYKVHVKNKTVCSGTTKYIDTICPYNYSIISVFCPLYDNNINYIGVIAADLPLNASGYLLDGISDVPYLNTGQTSIAYSDGSILDSETDGFWGSSITNIKSFSPSLWNNLVNNYNKTHYFIFEENIYRISSFPLSVQLYANGSAIFTNNIDYVAMMIVEEGDIMKYRDDSKDKIYDAGIIIFVITITCSLITVAVVIVLIHFLARSITVPLKGIIEFSNKINANVTEKDAITREELDQLKEGEDQVADLVRTYKELAGNFLLRNYERIDGPPTGQYRVFPRNELYRKNKLDWKKYIEKLN